VQIHIPLWHCQWHQSQRCVTSYKLSNFREILSICVLIHIPGQCNRKGIVICDKCFCILPPHRGPTPQQPLGTGSFGSHFFHPFRIISDISWMINYIIFLLKCTNLLNTALSHPMKLRRWLYPILTALIPFLDSRLTSFQLENWGWQQVRHFATDKRGIVLPKQKALKLIFQINHNSFKL